MKARVLLAALALFSVGMTGCTGSSDKGVNPFLPPGSPNIVEEYLDASAAALATSYMGSHTWSYTVKAWGGVNQTITTEAVVAESSPEQVSIYVKRLTDNSADQIILLAREMVSSGTFSAGEQASIGVRKK